MAAKQHKLFGEHRVFEFIDDEVMVWIIDFLVTVVEVLAIIDIIGSSASYWTGGDQVAGIHRFFVISIFIAILLAWLVFFLPSIVYDRDYKLICIKVSDDVPAAISKSGSLVAAAPILNGLIAVIFYKVPFTSAAGKAIAIIIMLAVIIGISIGLLYLIGLISKLIYNALIKREDSNIKKAHTIWDPIMKEAVTHVGISNNNDVIRYCYQQRLKPLKRYLKKDMFSQDAFIKLNQDNSLISSAHKTWDSVMYEAVTVADAADSNAVKNYCVKKVPSTPYGYYLGIDKFVDSGLSIIYDDLRLKQEAHAIWDQTMLDAVDEGSLVDQEQVQNYCKKNVGSKKLRFFISVDSFIRDGLNSLANNNNISRDNKRMKKGIVTLYGTKNSAKRAEVTEEIEID